MSLICWITHFGEYQRPLDSDWIYMDIYGYIWIYDDDIYMSNIYAQKSICQNSLQRVDFQDTALNWSKFSNTGTEIQNIIQNSNTNCLQMRTLEESEVSGHSEVLPFCHLPCSVRGHKVCNVLKWPSREMTYVISRQISGNVKCSGFSQFLIFLGSFLWH